MSFNGPGKTGLASHRYEYSLLFRSTVKRWQRDKKKYTMYRWKRKRTSGNVMFELGDEKIKKCLLKSRVKRRPLSGKNFQSIKSPIYKRERAEEYFVAKNK